VRVRRVPVVREAADAAVLRAAVRAAVAVPAFGCSGGGSAAAVRRRRPLADAFAGADATETGAFSAAAGARSGAACGSAPVAEVARSRSFSRRTISASTLLSYFASAIFALASDFSTRLSARLRCLVSWSFSLAAFLRARLRRFASASALRSDWRCCWARLALVWIRWSSSVTPARACSAAA
jgi:hypothetical protein